jgi:pimeloyl-ACP methyl ester carboxylesterase
MLAVIDKGRDTASHDTPLLFVHGAFHAAWCWDEHFLDYFADLGYRVLALDLRGHGSSPAGKPLQQCGIADYVADLRSVAADLPTGPVLIGHSMGGFIVQKYLEDGDAPACVLLASAPPRGLGLAALRGLRRHPLVTLRAAITRDPLHQISGARSREALFSSDTPDHLVASYAARVQQESQKALASDMIMGDLPRPDRVDAPMLVLAGEFDGTITAKESEATATAYRTTAEFFPMGHNMMLEPGWRSVAERIEGWLIERGL